MYCTTVVWYLSRGVFKQGFLRMRSSPLKRKLHSLLHSGWDRGCGASWAYPRNTGREPGTRSGSHMHSHTLTPRGYFERPVHQGGTQKECTQEHAEKLHTGGTVSSGSNRRL